MILLHLILFIRRLRGEPKAVRALGQGVFDLFCRDMDHSFRETGIGDLAVPKNMRRVAEASYGRAAAYDRAIETAGQEQLAAVLARTFSRNPLLHPRAPGGWRITCAAPSSN